ncbi:hypothetical protein AVEN_80109-1 [Araneus ventricosus]|uniref:Uncharacterized protein n=1 Tax=Araneus ventricosus TaxID=182803 RepID=A0A4Y2NEJ7_ARAVE|nr:hypothetical protein AVEN_80109-1 [Araneus ventricosus]
MLQQFFSPAARVFQKQNTDPCIFDGVLVLFCICSTTTHKGLWWQQQNMAFGTKIMTSRDQDLGVHGEESGARPKSIHPQRMRLGARIDFVIIS